MSADLDREIDLAVRSMVDRDSSPCLWARVQASIDGRDQRRRPIAFLALPAAAAAVVALILVIIAPWTWTSSRGPARPVGVADGHDVALPPLVARSAPPRAAVIPAAPVGTARMARREPRVHATSVEEPAAAGIDALAAPAPLSVETIAAPASAAMPSIQPAPLRVNALDLPALEMPRDAAQGEDR